MKRYGDIMWVTGWVSLEEGNRLNATCSDAPITGFVSHDGDHRYTDSQGVIHVFSTWRLHW